MIAPSTTVCWLRSARPIRRRWSLVSASDLPKAQAAEAKAKAAGNTVRANRIARLVTRIQNREHNVNTRLAKLESLTARPTADRTGSPPSVQVPVARSPSGRTPRLTAGGFSRVRVRLSWISPKCRMLRPADPATDATPWCPSSHRRKGGSGRRTSTSQDVGARLGVARVRGQHRNERRGGTRNRRSTS